jgi:hypothetical protein
LLVFSSLQNKNSLERFIKQQTIVHVSEDWQTWEEDIKVLLATVEENKESEELQVLNGSIKGLLDDGTYTTRKRRPHQNNSRTTKWRRMNELKKIDPKQ